MKNKGLKAGGLLFILFAAGFIGKSTYCRLCDPNDATCKATCGVPNPEPTPTPTPVPTPTPQECLPLIPWCNELTPPAQCSTKAQPCKHNPTTDPTHCELAPACIEPEPTPTPTTPIPTPTPGPDTDIKKVCGLPMPNGVSVFIKAKPYGQGVDTELNVLDWPALCYFIHGNPVNPNQCHLEGLDSKGYSRVACEMAIIDTLSNHAGKCPVGIWRNAAHGEQKCYQDDPFSSDGMSCDHFGNTVTRDDPATPPFEGEPQECGLQRDENGKPMAGFFWISHGDGEVKACMPNYDGCSRGWLRVVH